MPYGELRLARLLWERVERQRFYQVDVISGTHTPKIRSDPSFFSPCQSLGGDICPGSISYPGTFAGSLTRKAPIRRN